ncbi:MAG: GIY-YIG nuclease family protein [Arcobacteraceae bacterium]|jgi:hypothetical protein|nr:GIY-YIG nuclease family protein [Arcobacteraceae bacterium]
MNSYVYLLVTNNDYFKIGKADDIDNRYNTLKNLYDFNLLESYTIEITKKEVFKLEKTLHFLFSDYRVKNLPKQDGYSEFFKLDCLNNLLNILKSLKNFKDLSIVKGIQLTKIISDLKPKFDRKEKKAREIKVQNRLNDRRFGILNNFVERYKMNLKYESDNKNIVIRFDKLFLEYDKEMERFNVLVINTFKSRSMYSLSSALLGGENYYIKEIVLNMGTMDKVKNLHPAEYERWILPFMENIKKLEEIKKNY